MSLTDSFRVWSDILVEIRDKDGNLKHSAFHHNLRTNVGADFWNKQLFTTSPSTKGAGYLAIATGSTVSAVDTVLTGELLVNGLQRTAALTPVHASATGQSTFTNIFTYTGSSTIVVGKAGLFNDTHASGGTLVLEAALSPSGTVNASGDQITIVWTINY
jgi:hypothetical protein